MPRQELQGQLQALHSPDTGNHAVNKHDRKKREKIQASTVGTNAPIQKSEETKKRDEERT